MIFDRLWWAAKRSRKEYAELSARYKPQLEAAKKKNDREEYETILSEWRFLSDMNEDYEILRTQVLVERARKLGIPVPPKPLARDKADENEDWDLNYTTGSYTLSGKGEFELRTAIRKEKRERREVVEFWVKLVGTAIAILTGLIGAAIGLVSVLKK